MLTLNVPLLFLLAVAAGGLVMLLLLAGDARRLAQAPDGFLLWAFLRRRGMRRHLVVARLGERATRIAEMRCSTCTSHEKCLERLDQGHSTPVADCPNAELTEKGVRTLFQRRDSEKGS